MDTNKTVRIKVELDDAEARAKMAALLSGGSSPMGSGGSPAGPASSAGAPGTAPRPSPGGGAAQSTPAATAAPMPHSNAGAPGTAPTPAPGGIGASSAMGMVTNAGASLGRMASSAAPALVSGAAGNASGILGMAGGAAGSLGSLAAGAGPIGLAAAAGITAVTAMAVALASLPPLLEGFARSLAPFSGGLFQASTMAEFSEMGRQYKLAGVVDKAGGGELISSWSQFKDVLLDQLSPVIAELVKLATSLAKAFGESGPEMAMMVDATVGLIRVIRGVVDAFRILHNILSTIPGAIDAIEVAGRTLLALSTMGLSEVAIHLGRSSDAGEGADALTQYANMSSKFGGEKGSAQRGWAGTNLLFGAFHDWGRTAVTSPNPMHMRPEDMPNFHGARSRGLSPAEVHVINSSPGSSMPRPTPAVVNFKVTDHIQLHLDDEERIHNELSNFRNAIMDELRLMSDRRWISRLATMQGAMARPI